jgi:hypothetical protein
VSISAVGMAEAAAVIELVSSIASLVDLSAKVVSRPRDFASKTSNIPESFRSLSTQLPFYILCLYSAIPLAICLDCTIYLLVSTADCFFVLPPL